jgi:hypothetical protein
MRPAEWRQSIAARSGTVKRHREQVLHFVCEPAGPVWDEKLTANIASTGIAAACRTRSYVPPLIHTMDSVNKPRKQVD